MTMIRKFLCLSLAMGAVTGAAPAGPSDDPAAYKIRIPVTPAPGSLVQRLPIPAEVLAAAQTVDLLDVRVFDAANRAMPIARIAPAAGPQVRHELTVLPILGSADALNVTGVSLRIGGDGRARVARVDGTVAGGPVTATVSGVLLEARAIAGSATSLILDADVPGGQPVSFTVEASADLKNWRPLSDKAVYRPAMTGGNAVTVVFLLNGAALSGDYLRITWGATSRLLAPVTVRKAGLFVRAAAGRGPDIRASLPALIDAHTVEFAVSFATPLDRLRMILTGNDVLVPIRVLGRDNAEQPWTNLGNGTAIRSSSTATGDIALKESTHRTIRIEADQRTAGFTSPPAIALGFAPQEIAFLASGQEPFTLAAGQAGATDPYLPIASLMTQSGGTLSTATARSSPRTLQLQSVGREGVMRRATLLWIVLLAATGLLAAMAWALWRHAQARPPRSD